FTTNPAHKSFEVIYTFDDKNAVSKNYSTSPSTKNINNILTSEVKYFSEDGTIYKSDSNVYTFEYNGKDFPVKRTDQDGNYTTYEYEWVAEQ
ncbi:MAG: hypothetical protein GY756_17275, partial [bacterium]|nr:hypothetical protein [bacterium]